jgi:WD40 repeat protein
LCCVNIRHVTTRSRVARIQNRPQTYVSQNLMASQLLLTRYTQRWQVETVNSMLESLVGSQGGDLSLRVTTLNVMILKRRRIFYGESMKRFAKPLQSVMVIASGSAVLWAHAGAVRAAEEPLATLAGHKAAVQSMAYSPNGKTLASGSADKTIKLWDVSTGKEITNLQAHADGINSLVYSPDGKTLVSGSADKTIKLWDAATGKELATLQGHKIAVTTLEISPDGKTLASVGVNLPESYRSEIKLWDFDAAATRLRVSLPDDSNVRSLAFNPDSKTLAFGSESAIKRWDVVVGKELASPKIRAYGSVSSVAYSPDGKEMAFSVGYGNRPSVIVLWDLATDKERINLGKGMWGLGNVAYSPDGKTLAVWARSYDPTTEIRLWDPLAGKERATLHTTGVGAVAFSPDGKTLAISDGPTIKLWKVPQPQ